jgi:hypothetical protein
VLFSPLIQQPIDQTNTTALLITGLISLVLAIISIIIYWTIFEKAGKPGWTTIIPIYNVIVFLDIVGRPRWWFILLFVPLVNVIISLMLMFDLARVFGKGAGFAIGLIVFAPLFLLILAFDDSR